MATERQAHWHSFAKAVSWRATGTRDTFVISYLVAGRIVLAGSIAGIEVVTKILLYYGHGRAWTVISWGRR